MEPEPEHVLPEEIWGEIVQYLDKVEAWATMADVSVGLRDAVSKIPGVYQVDGREGLVEALGQDDARYIIVVKGGLTVDRAPDNNGRVRVVTRRGGMTVSGTGVLYLVGKGASATVNGGYANAYAGARIETVNGGYAFAYDGARIETVTGGHAFAYGNSTITGGQAFAQGNAIIKAVTAGEIFAYENSTVAGVTGGTIEAWGNAKVFLEVAAQVDGHAHVVGDGVTVTGYHDAPISVGVEVHTPQGRIWPQ